MSKKSINDYFNVAQLGNHGRNHADDNPRKLKKTIACTCRPVWTRILREIYSYRTDVVFFFKHAKQFLTGPRENKFKISQELRKHRWNRHAKIILCCAIWGFWSLFSWAPIRTFSLQLFHRTYYIYSHRKVWKRMQYAWNYSGTRFLYTEN